MRRRSALTSRRGFRIPYVRNLQGKIPPGPIYDPERSVRYSHPAAGSGRTLLRVTSMTSCGENMDTVVLAAF